MMTPISGTRFGITVFGIVLALALGSAADAQTAQSKLSPDEMYALAREAHLYAYPIVSMDVSMRQATNVPDTTSVNMRAPVNQFAHARAYPKADEKDVVRFNFDTLYSLAWLDLSREPIILSVPDTNGRYYLLPMIDMWTDVFAMVGSRTTGTNAGNYAIVGPNWSGSLPEGVVKIVAPHISDLDTWPHSNERSDRLRERPQSAGRLQADAAIAMGQGLRSAQRRSCRWNHRQQDTADVPSE